MERLRPSDLMALLDSLERIYALGTLERYRCGVLAPVAKLIPGVRFGYVESNLGRGQVAAQVDPPDAMPPGGEATLQRHVHEHLLTIRYQQTGDRGPYMVAEVLALIAAGRTDGDVAELLCVSRRTVQKHLANIYNTLGVRTRTVAAVLAFQTAQRGVGRAQPEGRRRPSFENVDR